MANIKITELAELTAVDGADLLEIVDDAAGTPISKKATVDNVQQDWHVGARVYNNAALTITNNTWTALTLNSERYDTDTIHDTDTNPARLTCNKAGKYLITGHIVWVANTTGRRILKVRLNGTTDLVIYEHVPVTGAGTYMNVTTIYDLSATDYVEMLAFQSSGGNLDISVTSNISPEFMMQRVG